MSNYKIQNVSYSIASNLYDKNSKLIDRVSQQASQVQDRVSIGHMKSLDFGGVKTELSVPKADILFDGDNISSSNRKVDFFNIIKDKFNQIRKTETLSSNDAKSETNLVELTASLTEAEIAVQQIVQIRDKIVSGYKEILNSAF